MSARSPKRSAWRRASLTPIPDGVDFATAAAFGVGHRTAYHALRSVAVLQPGEDLVVLGAGGGVGLAAVALGAHLGASVTAVASSDEKLAVAREQGAPHASSTIATAIYARRCALAPTSSSIPLAALSEPALRALRWGGRFVTVGYASGEIPRIPLNLVLLKGITVMGFEFGAFARNRPAEIDRNDAELAELFASGAIRPHIGARFTLDEVADALRYVADGRAIGKVVLDVRP